MTPPTTEPAEPTTRTPRVCTCGYDLAGLPTDAGAKCPECGAVIADIGVRPSSFFSIPLLFFFAFAPAVALAGLIAWDELSYEAYKRVVDPSGLPMVLGLWLAFGSTAAIAELNRVFRRPGRWWLALLLVPVGFLLFMVGVLMMLSAPLG